MKTKKIILMLCAVLLCVGTAPAAESGSTEGRARIGVLLDRQPLPDLLLKHLHLSSGQGIRINNVQRNSPADKAGLQRDDIIIGFQGEDINSFDQLVDAVQEAGAGTEVSLEIIHLGERKTLKLQLDAFEDRPDLKYPPEPDIFQSWRPGKVFRLKPGDKDWIEIVLPFDGKSLEVYDYHHSGDGADYSITIEGNPDDEDTKITVRIGRDDYKTTVGEIDKLPEKYLDVAKEALKNSREYSRNFRQTKTRKFPLHSMVKPDELFELLKDRKTFPITPDLPRFDPDNQMLDRIEEQMRKMQERIEELEKRFREIPERSSRKLDKDQI